MLKKLIIFDADGTLMDSENDVFLSFNHTLKTNTNFEITKDEFKKMAGLDIEKQFKQALPQDKKHMATELTKKFRQYYIDEKHFIDTTILFDGVKETIQKLKAQGFILVIITSKAKRAIDYMVQYFKFTEFDMIIGTGESDFKSKPDPETVHYTLEKFNIAKEDAVIIGDSRVDILTGKNAGIDTIAVTYGYEAEESLVELNPTYVLNNFSELKEIIQIKN